MGSLWLDHYSCLKEWTLKLVTLLIVLGVAGWGNLVLAADRTLSLVGVYNQSSVVFELDTNSPYYFGNEGSSDSTINYGMLLETPLQGRWGFETGLIFLQRGYQVPDYSDSSVKSVYRWKSFYLPLVGRFHPTPMFTGSIGLYIDQAIGEVANFRTSDPDSISYNTMKERGFRSFDWGMTYSAGLIVDLNSSTRLLIEVRFNDSWSNLMDTSLPNVDKREKAVIHESQLFLGLVI